MRTPTPSHRSYLPHNKCPIPEVFTWLRALVRQGPLHQCISFAAPYPRGICPATIMTTCKRLQLQLQTAAPTKNQPMPKNLQHGQCVHPTQFRQQKCALICIALLGNARGLILRDRSKGADRCLQWQQAAPQQVGHSNSQLARLQSIQNPW